MLVEAVFLLKQDKLMGLDLQILTSVWIVGDPWAGNVIGMHLAE